MHESKDPVEAIRAQFPKACLEVVTFRGETTVYIDPPRIADVCLYLRDADGLRFNFLIDVTGIDYYPDEPRFAVAYHLYSMLYNRKLRLKVRLPGDNPHVPTVTGVWPTANWQEREAYDMFGIIFDGHPDLRRILTAADWEGHPQRKDYPLGYETVQFSFNFDEVNRYKPYAKE